MKDVGMKSTFIDAFTLLFVEPKELAVTLDEGVLEFSYIMPAIRPLEFSLPFNPWIFQLPSVYVELSNWFIAIPCLFSLYRLLHKTLPFLVALPIHQVVIKYAMYLNQAIPQFLSAKAFHFIIAPRAFIFRAIRPSEFPLSIK